MKRKLLSLALLAAFAAAPAFTSFAMAAAPAASAAISAPDPARHVEDLARLFRVGDVTALAEALIPPSKWEEIRLKYELERLEPTSDEDRAEFAEKIAKFTAPDAVERLMGEIEPKLEEARPQAVGAMLMAFGAMQMAVASPESDLTPEQRAALESALPGIQGWASGTDFLSSESMRRALTLLTDAARRTGFSDLDQIKALPLEGVLDRAAPLLAAAKDAVRIYGVDLDQIADSMRVEVLEQTADTARVRTTITLFNAPVWTDHDLVLVEGRWYGKQSLVSFHDHHHDHDTDEDAKDDADVEQEVDG